MRAPNCFILCSIIITVLLCSSRLVMGIAVGAGPDFKSQLQNSNLQGAQIDYTLQRLLEGVLNGVPMIINQLRDVETQLKILQQSSYQQAQQVNRIQYFVGGLLETVETVATQLNGIRNGKLTNFPAIPNFNYNPYEGLPKHLQSAGSSPPPPGFDPSKYDVIIEREKRRQAMEVANAIMDIRDNIRLDK